MPALFCEKGLFMEIRGIQKKYHKKTVLRDISLTAEPGKCIGLLGENGCGKSTLLSILAGIRKADAGVWLWEGQDLLKDRKLRTRLVGYVPQGTPLLEELSARDNLRLWYASTGRNLTADLKDGVPAMLGVTEFLDMPVQRLSGGMKKRLTISCATAHRPRILLLDEPSAALDFICKEKISAWLQFMKSQGATILLATHDMQELPLCDVWYILKEGRLEPYQYDGDLGSLTRRM